MTPVDLKNEVWLVEGIQRTSGLLRSCLCLAVVTEHNLSQLHTWTPPTLQQTDSRCFCNTEALKENKSDGLSPLGRWRVKRGIYRD